ncbi:hypothetical protein Pint_29650 [Pistacia integerrima]|uniref:Uncharacterized protein n=1 Tax=Pistacia integerrima TaxID=434235 RepID=A0ACC0X0X1_9ROSI|nr:hypothetical protein Pint_29650 [Pistacia integerrima]
MVVYSWLINWLVNCFLLHKYLPYKEY